MYSVELPAMKRFDLLRLGDVFESFLSVQSEFKFLEQSEWNSLDFQYEENSFSAKTKTRINKEFNISELVIKLPVQPCFHVGTKKLQLEQTSNFHKSSINCTDDLQKLWDFSERLLGDKNFNVDEKYSCTKERVDIRIIHNVKPKMITISFEIFEMKRNETNQIGRKIVCV